MKFKTKAPFGVATKRFATIGFHPNLDTTGAAMQGESTIGPGQYDPEPYVCPYKKYNTVGSPWKRKADVEEYSANLGFGNAKMLNERQYWRRHGGPGSYDVQPCQQTSSPSCYRDVGFGVQRRFRSFLKDDGPPPGTYGKDIAETSTLHRKQFTPVPCFEWDGFVDRFVDGTPNWKQAPNRYDPVDKGSISAVLNKVVSKRGPYDLFTGPRDETTIKNHFAASKFKGPLNYFNTWPNELDVMLNHPAKRNCGKFFKATRFLKKPTVRHMLNDISLCYKDPKDPSPCQYDTPSCFDLKPPTAHPFNMSVKEIRPGTKWTVFPGPGRYNTKIAKCIKGKTESWVFRSRSGRDLYKIIEYNSF